MLLGSMKESDHLGPESHQVHERHIGQSHQQKSNTHHWIALKKAGWVGSPTATLPPLEGRQALHISTEISQSQVKSFFAEPRVPH